MQSNAWFHVISRKSNAGIADSVTDCDAAGAGEHARHPILTNSIRVGASHWVSDLTHYCLHSHFAGVKPQPREVLLKHWRTPLANHTRKPERVPMGL